MVEQDIVALLLDAINRHRSVRLSVFYWADEAEASRSMRRFPQNKGLMLVADDLKNHADQQRNQSIWSVYVDRPYRYRVEHFISPDRLNEIAGGNEHEYWQYFPSGRRASLLPHEPDQTKTPLPLFLGWLPPAVSELLDPSFLLREPEGALEPVDLEVIGETRHAGRSSLRVRARISDWDSRVPWSETLRAAEGYELLVDKEVGTLLRVASLLQGREFSVYDVFDVQWNLPLHPSFFELAVPPGTTVSSQEGEGTR